MSVECYSGFHYLGREENLLNYGISSIVLERHGLGAKTPQNKKTPFDLGKNPEALKKEMESLGYTKIRMWYQTQNFPIYDGEEFAQNTWDISPAKDFIPFTSPEQPVQIRADIVEEFNRQCGPDVLDIRSFEVLVITAVKA